MRVFRWGKPDSVVLEALLAMAALAIVVFGIGPLLLGAAGVHLGSGPTFGRQITVPVTLDTDVRVSGAPHAVDSTHGSVDAATGGRPVKLAGPYTGQLTLVNPSTGDRLLYLAGGSVLPLVALAVIAYLLRIVRTLRRGDPFVPENARRLTAIALLIAVGGTVGNLVHGIALDLLVHGSAASGIFAHVFDVSFLPIVIGTAAAFLAEVFRQGARLRQDVEGLV
jgi:hypothetical protein